MNKRMGYTSIITQNKHKHNASPISTQGFTIVELLIVVVVIAILAAITIVAYNGVTDRAQWSLISSDASSIAQKIAAYKITSPASQYPGSLADLEGVVSSQETTRSYTVSSDGEKFCLQIQGYGKSVFVADSQLSAERGTCDGTTGVPGDGIVSEGVSGDFEAARPGESGGPTVAGVTGGIQVNVVEFLSPDEPYGGRHETDASWMPGDAPVDGPFPWATTISSPVCEQQNVSHIAFYIGNQTVESTVPTNHWMACAFPGDGGGPGTIALFATNGDFGGTVEPVNMGFGDNLYHFMQNGAIVATIDGTEGNVLYFTNLATTYDISPPEEDENGGDEGDTGGGSGNLAMAETCYYAEDSLYNASSNLAGATTGAVSLSGNSRGPVGSAPSGMLGAQNAFNKYNSYVDLGSSSYKCRYFNTDVTLTADADTILSAFGAPDDGNPSEDMSSLIWVPDNNSTITFYWYNNGNWTQFTQVSAPSSPTPCRQWAGMQSNITCLQVASFYTDSSSPAGVRYTWQATTDVASATTTRDGFYRFAMLGGRVDFVVNGTTHSLYTEPEPTTSGDGYWTQGYYIGRSQPNLQGSGGTCFPNPGCMVF